MTSPDRSLAARKRRLRRRVRAAVAAMDPDRRAREESLLLRAVPTLPGFAEAQTLLLYVAALPEEVPTRTLMAAILDSGRRLACPRVDSDARSLRLHRVRVPDLDLAPGVLGIPEPRPTCELLDPTAIDWALVPGLAFDSIGYRLGRGAGFYDRLLPQLRHDVPRWAVALSPQWVEELPRESHDQRLHGILGCDRRVVADDFAARDLVPAEPPP